MSSILRIPVTLQTPEGPLTVTFTTTEDKVPAESVMKAGATMSDALGGVATRLAEKHGTPIQCRKGCGHCCRQLVPVSAVEAFALEDAFEALPEASQQRIRERFTAAQEKLSAAGLDQRVHDIQAGAEGRAVIMEYFSAHIDCPFLEDEICQVYESRPYACRDLMVASAPEHCADPGGGAVRRIPVLMDMGRAMRSVSAAVFPDTPLQIPLPYALDWAAENRGLRGTVARGVDLVKGLLSALAGQARG